VVAVVGLILFARAFGEDTPDTRRRARRVMFGVYGLVLLLGLAFAVYAFSTTPIQVRTSVQSLIFLALGSGGLAVNARGGRSAV
jgi:multisubunit Na+/H+ antiporter MnhB subunit